jgi:hypothetical protein
MADIEQYLKDLIWAGLSQPEVAERIETLDLDGNRKEDALAVLHTIWKENHARRELLQNKILNRGFQLTKMAFDSPKQGTKYEIARDGYDKTVTVTLNQFQSRKAVNVRMAGTWDEYPLDDITDAEWHDVTRVWPKSGTMQTMDLRNIGTSMSVLLAIKRYMSQHLGANEDKGELQEFEYGHYVVKTNSGIQCYCFPIDMVARWRYWMRFTNTDDEIIVALLKVGTMMGRDAAPIWLNDQDGKKQRRCIAVPVDRFDAATSSAVVEKQGVLPDVEDEANFLAAEENL